jgi:hypothetical protein
MRGEGEKIIDLRIKKIGAADFGSGQDRQIKALT